MCTEDRKFIQAKIRGRREASRSRDSRESFWLHPLSSCSPLDYTVACTVLESANLRTRRRETLGGNEQAHKCKILLWLLAWRGGLMARD